MLTDAEQRHLDLYTTRLDMVRDRVQGVVEGYATGFYLWGEGGISKSWTVIDELERLGAPYHLSNTRLTPKGLYELLEGFPDVVHVLEDMESLTKAPHAASVLRAALWVSRRNRLQRHAERLVQWITSGDRREVIFTGGIIFTANRGLDDVPELRALKTRITHLQLQPTQAEVAALMKSIALKGCEQAGETLTTGECIQVYDYLIAKCDEAQKNYDIRMLVNGFADRLQSKYGHAKNDWQNLIESRMRERALGVVSRASRNVELKTIALEIHALQCNSAQKLKVWNERTGEGKSSYYRHRMK